MGEADDGGVFGEGYAAGSASVFTGERGAQAGDQDTQDAGRDDHDGEKPAARVVVEHGGSNRSAGSCRVQKNACA